MKFKDTGILGACAKQRFIENRVTGLSAFFAPTTA
jgi:hypothetical protein